MNSPKVLCWFRQDLRLTDNPAFSAAIDAGNVLPIYIMDDENAAEYKMGAASRFWLHYSLAALDKSLQGSLALYKGDPLPLINELCAEYNIKKIFWNRCYEPWQIKRDMQIKKVLEENGIEVNSYNGSLLWEPWTIKKDDGTPYKVFTPFYHKGRSQTETIKKLIVAPKNIKCFKDKKFALELNALELLPTITWYKQLHSHWEISEEGAHQCLENFIENGLRNYKVGRNFPAQACTSRLSPYLHFGQISPHQLWQTITGLGDNQNIEHFCSELGWREFSYNLLYFNPELPKKNLQTKFDRFPWHANPKKLSAWQTGKTGIPIVDAGMRELWQTGYMHNRVRMIVGSFLVKNLLLDWREGERWFWDCLVDADLANNSASWQWIAGCGADAAPYFRIFNPVTQGQKFDPQGEYVRKYIPELKNLPDKYLFNPWEAPPASLKNAGVILGKTYPAPIVDLSLSRKEALAAFGKLKGE